MRPRRRAAAAEMPAEFQLFYVAAWIDPTDPPEDAERLARLRWREARQAWGRENGWTPLEVLRRGFNARRIADGLPPIDYGRQQRWVTSTPGPPASRNGTAP